MKFSGLIGRKRNLIIALERKRKCMLRSAPFSRLRLWPHSRRRRSLNLARKDRSGLALPADQDADFFARLRLGRASARSELSELAQRKRRRGSGGANGAAARSHRRRGDSDRGLQSEGRPRRERQASARLRRGVRGFVAATLPDHRRPGSNWPQAESAGRSHPRGERGRAKIFGPERRRPGAARRATVKSGCYGTFASSTIAVRPSLTSARRRR